MIGDTAFIASIGVVLYLTIAIGFWRVSRRLDRIEALLSDGRLPVPESVTDAEPSLDMRSFHAVRPD